MHARQCVRAYVFESKVFVTMVLILIFGEVLGLYGYVIRSPEQSSRKLISGLQPDCCTHHELTSVGGRALPLGNPI